MRTEDYLKKLGTAVSAKPIVMRAEYAFCPNLTIIDTPGFVLKVELHSRLNCVENEFLVLSPLSTSSWHDFQRGNQIAFVIHEFVCYADFIQSNL